ncbi:hypothetical protein Pd630_LPD01143 [Rhodococcus opacus PD630]|nr:hypothetical protein Pd630_LPD01143 [Rhodococcus opacus PD630]
MRVRDAITRLWICAVGGGMTGGAEVQVAETLGRFRSGKLLFIAVERM